jgi:hypothetical protein
MANEAIIIELLGNLGNVVRYTVADGGAIPKGTLLKINDDRTATASAADNDAFAGIACSEKVASDGQTTIGAYTCGIFGLKDSGTGVAVGNRVSIKAANQVAIVVAGADDLFSDVGIMLETTAGGAVGAVLIGGGI